MTDPLDLAEAEMAEAAAEADTRYRVALAWFESADAELGALRRPTWGGVVDEWHKAANAMAEEAEIAAAFEAFPPLD
jgi:hypothetical protein